MDIKKEFNVILVNDFDYIQGGASKVAIDTANLLVENYPSVGVYFFTASHEMDCSLLHKDIHLISTNQKEFLKDKNKLRGSINGVYNLKAKKEFKFLLKQFDKKNTIIHVHGWTKCLSCSIFSIAFKMKFPLVLTLHDYFISCPNGGYFNYKKNQICSLKSMSWKCLKCNCDSRNYLFKFYRFIRQYVQNKVVKLNQRIKNVIYISDLQWEILKSQFPKNINAIKILNPIDLQHNKTIVNHKKNTYYLYVGRISKEKGVEIFCKACTKLKTLGIVVGDGEQRDYLQTKYPTIQFVGWMEKTQVLDYMLNAKAFVFPSLWYEGAGLTVEEALSVHLPCIVSDVSAAREKIVPGKNGFLFKTNDISDLVLKMQLVDSLSYEHISNSSSEINYIHQLVENYQNILTKSRR